MYDPLSEFEQSILPNGLEVHSVFWDRSWIEVEIIVHSGSREDPVEMPGLAHFVEHVVSGNIPKKSRESAVKFFEACGGQVSFGNTSYQYTKYDFKVPADIAIFQKALEIFGRMLLEAEIKRDIEQQRKIIRREFNDEYPFQKRLEWDMAIRKALFKGHRIETWNMPIGRPEGFSVTVEKDLQTYYDKHYVPRNMTLVTVGGLRAKAVTDCLLTSPFAAAKDGLRNRLRRPVKRFAKPREQETSVRFSDYYNNQKVDHTEYRAVWAFPSDFPLQQLSIFHDLMSKIMFEKIREKRNLTYDIDLSFFDFQDILECQISMDVSPDATSQIDKLVRRCISMVPERHDLFDQCLRSCINGCQMADYSGSDLASTAADSISKNHRITTIREMYDGYQKVSREDMAKGAALLSPERQYTFIMQP